MSIGIKISVDRTRYGGLDADAQAFITLSGITNETQINAINNIYKSIDIIFYLHLIYILHNYLT